MRFVVAFFGFWYAFIVGDDWRIAAGVTAVLAVGAVAVASGFGSPWLALALFAGLVLVFVAPMLVDRRGM